MPLSARTWQVFLTAALVGPLIAIVLVFYKPSNEMPPRALDLLSHVEEIAATAGGAISRSECSWFSKNGLMVNCPLASVKGAQIREALKKLGWVQTDFKRTLDGESTYSYSRGEHCARASESSDLSRLWLSVGCYR